MRVKRNFLLGFFLLCSLTVLSQNRISVSAFFDPRLAFTEDAHGNEPFTPHIMGMVSIELKQKRYGFLSFGQSIEFADLYGGSFLRYSVLQVGYTFNRIPNFESFELSFAANVGTIRRWQGGHLSYGANLELGYNISERFSAVGLLQVARRFEIEGSNDQPIHRISGFIGLRYDLLFLRR